MITIEEAEMDGSARREEALEHELLQEQEQVRTEGHVPELRVLRTPRERVQAFIEAAAENLRRGVFTDEQREAIADALALLDSAVMTTQDAAVVDGALIVEASLHRVRRAAQEGATGAVIDGIDEILELLERQQRPAPGQLPVTADDFTGPVTVHQRHQREAVAAVIRRHRFELAGGKVSTATLDDLIAAVEAGF